MRKYTLIIALVMGMISIKGYSQTISVESFALAQTDMTANLEGTMVRDQNGEVCALIKLETTMKGFTFDVGVLGVASVVEHPAEIWVYVPFGIRKITIQHPQLGILRDYAIPCAVERGRTYIMKIVTGTVRTVVGQSATKQFLSVKLDPSDAILEIDGRIKATNNGIYQELLPFGKYEYRAYSQNYHDLVGYVQISDPENTHKLDLKLRPAFGFVSVSERNDPEIAGAAVYIDQKYAGTIPIRNYKLGSGSHGIRIIKEMYKVYEDTFTISDEENRVLTPSMVPDFANITLKTASEADIYVNGEFKGKGTWSGRLASGSYIFESRQSGHLPSKVSYDLSEKDQSRAITVPDPTPVYGSLAVSSTPPGARIRIDGKYAGETPKYISRQVIGEHEVTVELNGYVAQKRKVNIMQGKESSLDFVLSDYINLSSEESANCYIITKPGTYRFAAVKGNTSESVGNVASVSVLWESFGTNVTPKVGDLIKSVSYSNRYISLKTSDTFREGNAVVAAKDASGTILWSWHLWFTDEPDEHLYNREKIIAMDRNLGATSASPGDPCALGLLYQWGRKDPFLNSSSINSAVKAKSTASWPASASSNKTTGAINYTVSHPMTFISANYDWYDRSISYDHNRWSSRKTEYDPCPPGWIVPETDTWTEACGTSNSFSHKYDKKGKGMNFSGSFSDAPSVWYPAGYKLHRNGGYLESGSGCYWSSDGDSYTNALCLCFGDFSDKNVNPVEFVRRVEGHPVRCVKKVTINEKEAIDLSADGTANCYIVSAGGDYKFAATKGNSGLPVENIGDVSVLWESFGTSVVPDKGDLISMVSYSDGYISFKVPSKFKEGNAVIAAKTSRGNGDILWSWHIWLTDKPKEQVYNNNAGTVMDRNLGAVSSVPGEEGTHGLYYQWGRKDPFLGNAKYVGSSFSSARSVYIFKRSIENPTKFFISENDWLDDRYNTENTRWQSKKTMYDPCPAGWKVPEGGADGVLAKAAGTYYDFEESYDDGYDGINFTSRFGSDLVIWYPHSGFISGKTGSYHNQYGAYYWTSTPHSENAKYFYFDDSGNVKPSADNAGLRSHGMAVRCVKEEGSNPYSKHSDLDISLAKDLSSDSSANCYIVSESGLYKFRTVKGNSSMPVGHVRRCILLWELFGTDVKQSPEMGELISDVLYEDDYIAFRTADVFKEGNALIAALDDKGNILWSWHIWLTDKPKEQIYNNNAGTVMDRNLGAVSAVPEEEGTHGLYYQWGRKDPLFINDLSNVSSILKPSFVKYSSSTIEYSIAYPETFIFDDDDDWLNFSDSTLWQPQKTVYDPCPPGWRVPDEGIWSKASGKKKSIKAKYIDEDKGINLTKILGPDKTIWYPFSGYIGGEYYKDYYSDRIEYNYYDLWDEGYYWTNTQESFNIDDYIGYYGPFDITHYYDKPNGHSVRCVKE